MIISVVGLRAEKAKIDHSDLTWGFPSPTAWAGLANAVGRRLTGKDWQASCVPVLHHQEMRFGRRAPEGFLKSGKFEPQGARPEMEAIIDFSLIISVRGMNDDDVGTALNRRVEEEILKCRIAGSPLFFSQDRPVSTLNASGTPLSFEDSAARALRRSGLGFLLLPHIGGSLVYRYGDEIGKIIRLIEEARSETNRVDLCPALVGYSFISEVAERSGGRNDMPHVFAEPVSGLIERRLLTRLDDISSRQMEGFAFHRRGEQVFVHKKYHDKTPKE